MQKYFDGSDGKSLPLMRLTLWLLRQVLHKKGFPFLPSDVRGNSKIYRKCVQEVLLCLRGVPNNAVSVPKLLFSALFI